MRRPRLTAPGLTYHIYSRGNNPAVIFRDEADYEWFWNTLGDTAVREGWRGHAVTLMPNHFHVVVQTPEDNLSRGMQRLLTRAALHFNRVHGTSGHVFQGRFGYRHCQRNEYLLELVRYVHLNPVRAGLARDPGDWTWSSHLEYLGVRVTLWIHAQPILDQFGPAGARHEIQRAAYRRFIADRMGAERFAGRMENEMWLGDDAFVEVVKREVRVPVRNAPRKSLRGMSLERLADVIHETMGIAPDRLRDSGRSRVASVGRHVLCVLAVLYAHHTVTQTARFLRRSAGIVSRAIRTYEQDGSTHARMQGVIDACLIATNKSKVKSDPPG